MNMRVYERSECSDRGNAELRSVEKTPNDTASASHRGGYMEKIGSGKDYSYTGRLAKLDLPSLPLKADWPDASASVLTRLSPKIAIGSGSTADPQRQVNQALALWNAAHSKRFAEKH